MAILCALPPASAEVHSIGGDVRIADSLHGVAQALDADPAETLVVIGPETPVADALAFVASLRRSRPAAGAVLLRYRADVDMLTQALQAGVREVVPAGNQEALHAACRRSREVTRQLLAAASPAPQAVQPGTDGRIITVFAAKGGCGKTTLATNLGVVLAQNAGQRVCVVDLDLAFGDVAISVQLDPARTIVDALPMAGHLDATGAASLVTSYRQNLGMLLAPVTPGDAEKIPPSLVQELLAVLRTMFDYVVVDTPAQLSEHVLVAMDASTQHVLLTTPDVPALKNLRVTLDMLDLLSYPRGVRSVVLNRSGSKVGLGIDDVERAVRCPVAAHVPSSLAVPVSINQGTPIALANPGHPVSQAITRFAQQYLLTPKPGPGRSAVPALRGRRRSA